MDERTHAHQARLDGDAEGRTGQSVVPDPLCRVAKRDDFGVCGRVLGGNRAVVSPPHDAAAGNDDRSDRHFGMRLGLVGQEQGLDVEDLRVRTLERMRRLFALVLLAAQFVFHLNQQWPLQAVLWLRKLGGKFGLTSDRDGPYILLRGLSALLQTIATLTWSHIQPFPHYRFPGKATYG